MSAPKALKAMSLRDSLAKTVRLLTKQGVDVQFRGYHPCVHARGGKVIRLVLPELNDSASPELIEAIQGLLDHEVGHIFYTPFDKAEKFAANNRTRHGLANILEDIRLEKLLPRELPGTKENLERMYDSVMEDFFAPAARRAQEPGVTSSEAFSCVMVTAMRALAGQKAFQNFMDDNKLWPHFEPLLKKMPDISKRLRGLETFKDVMKLAEDILEAMAPPEEEKDADDPQDDPANVDPEEDPDDAADDSGDGDEDDDSSGGEGHGDGEGTDDGEDDDDAGDCKGGPDEPSDEDGDDSGAGDKNDTENKKKGDDKDEDDMGPPADSDLEGNTGKSSPDAPLNRTLLDALALIEPTQRRALFLYKKRKQTVAEIAGDLSITEDETVDLLAKGSKRLRDLLNGGI